MLSDVKTPSWPRYWDPTVKVTSPKDARKLINHAASRNRDMLLALSAKKLAGNLHETRRFVRRYLISFTSKLAATAATWAARNGAIHKCSDDELLWIVNFAAGLNAFEKSKVKAVSWPKLKSDGESYRLIHDLEFGQRAIDRLAADAGRATSEISASQFSKKGSGGIPAVEAWLEDRLPHTEKVITVDIPSCFDVVRRSSVVNSLLLPKRVVEAAMFDVMDNAVCLPSVPHGIHHDHTHAVGTSAGERRVPQGSALAQLAADIEVDKVIKDVAAVGGSVHVAAVSDNLIFLLEDSGWTGSVLDALTSSVSKHFGPDVTSVLIKRIEYASPAEFWFCKRRYCYKKGTVTKYLPPNHFEYFEFKTMLRLQDAFAAKNGLLLNKCEDSIKGFLSAHSKAKGVLGGCVGLLVSLEQYRVLMAKNTLHDAS
ncbi:hypothetical protein [Blastomonas fulva]|uniref:hypothetical protein n=1 Tax=Blastomonas fulva TaxID=1550728 RepID=UPI003F70800F